MTLLISVLLSIIAGLVIGLAVVFMEWSQLIRKYNELQNRCWGMREELMGSNGWIEDEDWDDDENEKENGDEKNYH